MITAKSVVDRPLVMLYKPTHDMTTFFEHGQQQPNIHLECPLAKFVGGP